MQLEETAVLPSVLLDDLQGICMVKTQDWWTYEVCYQQQVGSLAACNPPSALCNPQANRRGVFWLVLKLEAF